MSPHYGHTVLMRCTAKLITLLRVPRGSLVEQPGSSADWYANLIWVGGRKCLLVMHAGTLFSVFIPDVRVTDLRALGPFLADRITAALTAEALPVDALGPLDPHDVAVAKTADRRVLGSMNDAAFRCEWWAQDSGGLTGLDLDKLHHHLQRTPCGARGYAYPIDLARAWAGATEA